MEGGSANDYEYAEGDSVNGLDLDGRNVCRKQSGQASVEDYLAGRVCPPDGFGYTPVHKDTKAGHRALDPSGECSWTKDTGMTYDFQNACKTHDYGYDLRRAGALRDRKAVDQFFRGDMRADCRNRGFVSRRVCYRIAERNYVAVRAFAN